MPNHTRLAVCPYYLSDNDKSVTCEDTIRQFRTRELKRSYLQEYCCSFRWKDCPYARALDQVYEKISMHPEEAESIYYEHQIQAIKKELARVTSLWRRDDKKKPL